jgi:hypothetical protein
MKEVVFLLIKKVSSPSKPHPLPSHQGVRVLYLQALEEDLFLLLLPHGRRDLGGGRGDGGYGVSLLALVRLLLFQVCLLDNLGGRGWGRGI